VLFIFLLLNSFLSRPHSAVRVHSISTVYQENQEWIAPSEEEIPADEQGDLIRYGKELISNTSTYLGPKGIVAPLSNGMNCQNCHSAAGTQNFGNPFSAVVSTYPKYRERSGKIESLVFRVNECMQRSMNGHPLDSNSMEMKAILAYLNWVGQGVPKGIRPVGAGVGKLPYLNRAADTIKGKRIYQTTCLRCHGDDGAGILTVDATHYVYPPLWGDKSFNTSAGMQRLSMLAGFIKNNMPYGSTWKQPQLTNEEAWDVAAYISSKPRPRIFFNYDWPDLSKKPVDYPFGPYKDSFSELQHRYGPFEPMKN
jgi:thiosulfate dehydrogenase